MNFLFVLVFFAQNTPDFNDYPTDCREFKKVAELETKELPQLEYVFKQVKLQWSIGTNAFACRYFIIQWGCGSGCQVNAIFNQETGKRITSLNTTMGCEFQANSRLLIANADPMHERSEEYYLFENDELRRLR